jgi:hypothetical protein
VSLFGDDLASDVRADYRAFLVKGLTGPEATDALLARGLPDIDEAPTFWIALAAVQSKLGRLEPRVRDQALALMETDIVRWEREAPKLAAKRRKVLDDLGADLIGPSRPEVRIRPYRPLTTEFCGGEVIAFERDDGRFALLRVAEIDEGHDGDRVPVLEVLDWIGTAVPPLEVIGRLPLRPAAQVKNAPPRRLGPARLHLVKMKPADRKRVHVLANLERPAPPGESGTDTYLWWAKLEGMLRWLFGQPFEQDNREGD